MKKNNCQGQTLLETVIAIAVILIGVTSLVTLFTAASIAGRQSTKQVIAANLAREGIEVARQIRDTNWLEMEQNESTVWADGLNTTMDFTTMPIFNASDFSWSLSFLPDDFTTVCPVNRLCAQVYQSADGIYLQWENMPPKEFVATPFTRLITVNPVSADQLEVICEVQWTEQNKTHSYQLVEYLYDWKYN